MSINKYLKKIAQRYNTGISTEHSYRSDLQLLVYDLVKGITVTNEPKRQKCGAPDYIIQKKEVPLGYIEAKDIGVDLNKMEKSDQIKRYLKRLDNLILTDYLEFRFYRYSKKVKTISIASLESGKFEIHCENFMSFETHIKNFCEFEGQTIKSAEKLAKMMAQKARMMEEVLFNVVKEEDNNSLRDQLNAFRLILIHDLDEKTFADIYAQTIAYGLFAARLYDVTLDDFSRQEARELIPKSNPFLRNLFDYISGAQLDERIIWIVDDLCEIFRATDLRSILNDLGTSIDTKDPFLDFYETFLSEYNPRLRKSRGVYFTPEPVVNFIVRSVDDILKEEFGIAKGLGDTSKIEVKNKSDNLKFHKVQILDPATGTGTFLTGIVKQIYAKFKGQEGLWSSYIDEHLIPRLNGFEILMAPYTMCHLKLEMLFKETGYKVKKNKNRPRLKIYLTNSLEEAHTDTGTLFASWLSKEAIEANYVKKDTPVMIILGNPPYSGESQNKGKWIMNLMEDYKKEPGGEDKLKEKTSKWINDDYVKFLRFSQYLIEKNGEGVLAFINPHGFLDNPTFRGMRWNLLKNYDKIYILNLHGNYKKKETSPDGSKDENVFDIMQGVSINIFIKSKQRKNKLGEVYHCDLFGTREKKYKFLLKNNLRDIKFKKLIIPPPHYLFIRKDYTLQKQYDNFFSINDIFTLGNSGVVTKRDKLNIHKSKQDVIQMIDDVINMDEQECRKKYSIPNDVRDWNFSIAREDIISSNSNSDLIKEINYRPFEKKYFYYSGKSKGVVGWPVPIVSDHLKFSDNIGLMTTKKVEVGGFKHAVIYRGIVESHAVSIKEINYVFPLYLYPQKDSLESVRKPNFNKKVTDIIEKTLNLKFTIEKETTRGTFAPIDLLDYIYAVLNSFQFRKKFKEFLNIDFPRVPNPSNKKTFWKLVDLGAELRTIHLLENPVIDNYISTYPMDGNNVVEEIIYKEEKIYINQVQFFNKVPDVVWRYYIGGYQPAQKWLKDRKGKELSVDDILHYQKILVALNESNRVMKTIDKII